VYDTLPVLQGVAMVEGAVSVLAWIGLGTIVYCCWKVYSMF